MDWTNVVGSVNGYYEGTYKGMHCELFFNTGHIHRPMAWQWSFYDDNSPDPDLAVALGEGFATIASAEADMKDYIDGYLAEDRYR